MVDFRINETLQTGAGENRTYRVGVNAVRWESRYMGIDPIADWAIYAPLCQLRKSYIVKHWNRKGKKSETSDFKRHTVRYVAGCIR